MPLPFLFAGLGAIVSSVGAAAAATGAAVAGAAATVGTAAAAAGTAVAGAAATVGTAAAAAGTAVAGAAATVGTTAAAAATAVGTAAASTAVGGAVVGAATAVGSAATAVGTAAASTAVGSAVIGTATGAMAAVGTGVGAVAGAASAAPIIGSAAGAVATVTGTTAGAAAVGTITTSVAVGATSGLSGAAKLSEASEIKEAAVSRYERKRKVFDSEEADTNKTLETLGKHKLEAWEGLQKFVTLWERILNKPELTGEVSDESLHFTKDQLEEVKYMALSAKDLVKNGTVSLSGGALAGFAAKTGASTLVTTASTGTAIGSLSGAAASNATLAAFGGGALNVGGLGMAGGQVVLQGLTFAPTLAISGIMLNHQGKKSLEAAESVQKEVDELVSSMDSAMRELKKLKKLSNDVDAELRVLNLLYTSKLNEAEALVNRCADYKKYSIIERKQLEQLVLIVKLLKELTTHNLIKDDKIQVEQTQKCVEYCTEQRFKITIKGSASR